MYIYIYICTYIYIYIYIYIFIAILHELLCIYKKTNIYYNAMLRDFKIQNAKM